MKMLGILAGCALVAILWRAFDDWLDGTEWRREFRERKARTKP